MADDTDNRVDLRTSRRVHIIGAGGSGMSAIATALITLGHRVSGSDASDSPALARLSGLGATVHVGHDAAWLGDAEVVVRSTAIPADNAEVMAAERMGLKVWRRSEVLASLCALKRTVGVSGTHGKTTTSSILALILMKAGWHPSMIIGGEIAGIGSGARWDPEGEWFVVEADESDGTFLDLGAEAVVVTSVEADHLDFYGTEQAMRRAYERFVSEAPGPAVICADDPVAAALARLGRPQGAVTMTYGTSSGADVAIRDTSTTRRGSRFSLLCDSREIGPIDIAVPGLHNVRNATAAMVMAHLLGVAWEDSASAVASFAGVGRRFEYRGERNGVTFVDDYGHHPSEVAAMVRAAGAGGWDRLVVVFQPHRYSRTEALWRDFADAFVGADVLVVTDIYPAGEAPRPGVSGRMVSDGVRASHPDLEMHYQSSLGDVVELLKSILRPGDLCLTLGAGNLTTVPGLLIDGAGWD